MFMAAYPALPIYFNGYIVAGRAREFAYAIAKKRTVPMQPHSRMLSYFGEPLLCGAVHWTGGVTFRDYLSRSIIFSPVPRICAIGCPFDDRHVRVAVSETLPQFCGDGATTPLRSLL